MRDENTEIKDKSIKNTVTLIDQGDLSYWIVTGLMTMLLKAHLMREWNCNAPAANVIGVKAFRLSNNDNFPVISSSRAERVIKDSAFCRIQDKKWEEQIFVHSLNALLRLTIGPCNNFVPLMCVICMIDQRMQIISRIF